MQLASLTDYVFHFKREEQLQLLTKRETSTIIILQNSLVYTTLPSKHSVLFHLPNNHLPMLYHAFQGINASDAWIEQRATQKKKLLACVVRFVKAACTKYDNEMLRNNRKA